MINEKHIKRYEPLGYLLALGIVCIFLVFAYAIFKFHFNLINGDIASPEITPPQLTNLGILISGSLILLVSHQFFNRQRFNTFRTLFAISFFLFLFFVVVQVAGVPLKKVNANISKKELGSYYFGFLMGLHLLFIMVGLIAQALMLGRIYTKITYVDTFIFSVNPPNILNLRLLVQYFVAVGFIWAGLIFYLLYYAA